MMFLERLVLCYSEITVCTKAASTYIHLPTLYYRLNISIRELSNTIQFNLEITFTEQCAQVRRARTYLVN